MIMTTKLFRLFAILTVVALIAGTVFYIHDKNEPHLRFAKGDPDAPSIEMTVGNGNEKVLQVKQKQNMPNSLIRLKKSRFN